jgi:predicted metal-dependent hydrolase
MDTYRLVRSGRKTLALSVDQDGNLTIRAPYRTPQSRIDALIFEKQSWIARVRARMACLPPRRTFVLAEGSGLPFLGETLTLRPYSSKKVARNGASLFYPPSGGTDAVIRWLETQARGEFAARTQRLAERLGLKPATLRLSRAQKRWGSMSGRGTLSLNRALILCPPDVIDYVIVHELCHIRHPNHSAAFWALVERFLPDYHAKRDWLKAHAALIDFLPR